jgi:protein phosphatase
MRWSSVTSAGLVRAKNEDGLCVNGEYGLFAVADGMGGHQAGEVASRLALAVLNQQFQRLVDESGDVGNSLLQAVKEANRQVFEESSRNETYNGMGTTLSACVIRGDRLFLAHVGDSRVYLVRSEEMLQLTEDHSVIQELLNEGRIRAEDVPLHLYRNVLSRALGTEAELEVDLRQVAVRAGDRVLLCTDGLTNQVPDETIRALIESVDDPEQRVQDLLRLALDRGGTDNITLILVVL